DYLSHTYAKMDLNLRYDVAVVLLGDLPETLGKLDRYLLLVLLAGARKATTRRWLDPEPPTISEWREIVGEIHTMERLTFSLRLATHKYNKYWKK
uniref:Uncharacterized protein n=1 Tax=Poecilia formosa TaxID=48698 RepID=A0A096M4L1_POEFO